MKSRFLILLVLCALTSCARGPLRLVEERRFFPNWDSGFSDRVVTESNLLSDNSSLYFGTRTGTVYALEANSGKKKWKVAIDGGVDSQLALDQERLYVGTSSGHFYSLSTKDGRTLWQQKVTGEIVGQPGLIPNDSVFFAANDGILYAADAKTGEIRWRYRSDIPDRIGIHGFARPLVVNQKVYAALGDGTVAQIRANDGMEVSRQRLEGRVRFPEVIAPLLATNGKILAAQFFGTLHALGLDGTSRWSVPSGGTGAAPVVSEKVVYAGGADNQLMALDSESGERKWAKSFSPTSNWSGIILHRGLLVASTHEGRIFVVKPEDGSVLWTYDVTGDIPAAPVVVGERVWVLTNRAQLLGLELRATRGARSTDH